MRKIIAIILVTAVITGLLCGCKKKGTDISENYEIGPDRFPSITFVLGERELVSEKKEGDTLCYVYKTNETGNMDIYEYMSYLIDNCGGVVTSALNEGEEGSCELAMESDEDGYVVVISFEYKADEYTVKIKRIAGKINMEM